MSESQKKTQLKKRRQSSQDAMLVGNALVAAKSRHDWIVDSGATSHMCNDQSMLTELKQLDKNQEVTLGDGSTLNVTGEGTVDMNMVLKEGITRECTLKKVLYVPKLAYNLVSVPRAVDAKKTVHFNDTSCEFWN